MTTSKAARARLPRKTDNYVASIRKLFADPETVPDSTFLKGKYITDGTNLGTASSNEGAFSIVEPIGFNIEINGKVYKEFSVAMAGWIFLRDPDGGSTNPSNFWTDILNAFTSIHDNDAISAAFSYNHIFLPIWFDRNHSIASSVAALQAADYSSKITSTVANDIASGIDTRYWPYDPLDYGVRYVNIYDSKKGKCLLVRWTVSQRYYGNRLKFEIALFENGTIEYRYWPIKTFEASDTSAAASSATVGVWWHRTAETYLYRDFSTLFDYKKNQRTLSSLGGAIYDGVFYDSSGYYGDNIKANSWPKNGAVITFSPPVKPLKVLPRKVIGMMAATREIVRSPGMFDDRKTIPFITGSSIYLPSTLPNRLLGDSGDVDVSLRQMLFLTGSGTGSFSSSIGNVNKNVVDSQLAVLDAIEKLNRPVDLSFNEHQKNYKAISSTDSFYVTGSSTDTFGFDFSAPLKSKTQFHFSLPVSKQTTMPSLTSSIYYYNAFNRAWEMVNPDDLSSIGRIISEPEDNLSSYEYQLVSPVYRVVETAKGFDAVGRKVSSGSNVTSTSLDSSGEMQSDNAIGSIINSENINLDDAGTLFYTHRGEAANSAHFRKYKKSLSDAIDYSPSRQQKIDFETNEPFLLEKLSITLPLYINGDWFRDVTTCCRAFTDDNDVFVSGDMSGRFRGPVDFGGPGITVALFCHRSSPGVNYLDLIASGTITHTADATNKVILKKDPGMKHYSLRPSGFNLFSNPTCVISGSNNIFEGSVTLDLVASVAGGITIARLDRSYITSSYATPTVVSDSLVTSNRNKAIQLLTNQKLFTRGETTINAFDMRKGTYEPNYDQRSPRVYVQQVSSLSRGSTGVEFSGNSIIGGTIAKFNFENTTNNPSYVSASGSLPSEYKNIIDESDFGFESVNIYSMVDVQDSPYLLFPGDKLTISISKTRPVVHKATYSDTGGFYNIFDSSVLTGSHGTVMLNTGSIELTLYGSYVRGGVGFNP